MMAPDAAASSPADAMAIAIHETTDRLQPPQLPQASPTDGAKDGGSTLSPRGPVRVNGLEGPCSSDQVIACTGHLVSAVLLYFVAGSFLLHSEKDFSAGLRPLTIVMLILHVPAMFLILISWWSCEKIDPSRPIEETLPNGWLWFKLSGPRWEKTRYCAVCRKAVPGLDHHCTWLQTCVGKANYAQFFTIAVAGTVQFLSQTLYATMCLVWLDLPYETTSDVRIAMQGVLIGLLLISVPCTLMYFILLGFHVYLHMLGYGTYEWMLRRRRKQRARAAEAAAAQGSSSSTTTATTSKRTSAARMTQRDTETSDARDSRLSSVGSANDFISHEDARTSSKSAQHELTAL